jgi:hypothetical protein
MRLWLDLILCSAWKESSSYFSKAHCNIFKIKRLGKPIREADVALRVELAKKKKNEKGRVSAAGEAKQYLTDNEELAIVQMCRVLSMCGRGVTKDELLNITNEYIHHHEDAILSHYMKWGMSVGNHTKRFQKRTFSIWMKLAMTRRSIDRRLSLTRLP